MTSVTLRNRTPALSKTGVPNDMVAGTGFGADLIHAPVVTSRWKYVTAKQGARKMKRIGILQ